MTKQKNIFIITGSVCFLLTWLFTGVFRDDEFFEPDIFTKYRPTFKVYFYSPVMMQDLEIKDLAPGKQSEEIAFREFVMNRHRQNNSNAPLAYLPPFLIQLTLTFLTFGFYQSKQAVAYKIREILTHFLMNIFLTSLAIAFMLFYDTLYFMVLMTLVILAINFLTVFLLTRHYRQIEESIT